MKLLMDSRLPSNHNYKLTQDRHCRHDRRGKCDTRPLALRHVRNPRKTVRFSALSLTAVRPTAEVRRRHVYVLFAFVWATIAVSLTAAGRVDCRRRRLHRHRRYTECGNCLFSFLSLSSLALSCCCCSCCDCWTSTASLSLP